MRKITLICCVFVASTFLYSCEDAVIQENIKIASLTEEQIDQNIKNLSEVLANAVYNNSGLIKEIEKEISYRFDYDNDALIRTFIGRKIAGEKFEDILSNSSNGKYSSKDIKKMILESGYLQFTFPQNYKSLDYESVSPLAVPVYSFINEQDTEYLESFDKDGNIVKLCAKEMPNVPVIVVGLSERVDEDGYMRVSERSVVIPKERRSMHYTEAIKESRNNLKSARTNNHIVKILSQEEFDKLGMEQEPIRTAEYGANLKSANTSDIQLTGYTIKPKEMILSWSQYSNATYSSNRYKLFRGTTKIADQYNSCSKVDIAPVANSVYTYRVEYYYNDVYLSESNLLNLNSSHRQSGGYEYINYMYVSHAMVVAVEGWWVSELEIEWGVYSAKVDGTTETLGEGGDDWDTSGSTKYVGSDKDVNIFQWNKTSLVYTIKFWEDDGGTATESVDVWVDLFALAVDAAFAGNPAVIAISELAKPSIKKVITNLRKDDPMGQTMVSWWMHDNYLHNVHGNGFNVIISHKLHP